MLIGLGLEGVHAQSDPVFPTYESAFKLQSSEPGAYQIYSNTHREGPYAAGAQLIRRTNKTNAVLNAMQVGHKRISTNGDRSYLYVMKIFNTSYELYPAQILDPTLDKLDQMLLAGKSSQIYDDYDAILVLYRQALTFIRTLSAYFPDDFPSGVYPEDFFDALNAGIVPLVEEALTNHAPLDKYGRIIELAYLITKNNLIENKFSDYASHVETIKEQYQKFMLLFEDYSTANRLLKIVRKCSQQYGIITQDAFIDHATQIHAYFSLLDQRQHPHIEDAIEHWSFAQLNCSDDFYQTVTKLYHYFNITHFFRFQSENDEIQSLTAPLISLYEGRTQLDQNKPNIIVTVARQGWIYPESGANNLATIASMMSNDVFSRGEFAQLLQSLQTQANVLVYEVSSKKELAQSLQQSQKIFRLGADIWMQAGHGSMHTVNLSRELPQLTKQSGNYPQLSTADKILTDQDDTFFAKLAPYLHEKVKVILYACQVAAQGTEKDILQTIHTNVKAEQSFGATKNIQSMELLLHKEKNTTFIDTIIYRYDGEVIPHRSLD
ncbi:MAG: hypothetical protein R3A45_07750 [Bdellovibrionota bacterium]